MKKVKSLLYLLALSSLALTGCKDKKEQTPTDDTQQSGDQNGGSNNQNNNNQNNNNQNGGNNNQNGGNNNQQASSANFDDKKLVIDSVSVEPASQQAQAELEMAGVEIHTFAEGKKFEIHVPAAKYVMFGTYVVNETGLKGTLTVSQIYSTSMDDFIPAQYVGDVSYELDYSTETHKYTTTREDAGNPADPSDDKTMTMVLSLSQEAPVHFTYTQAPYVLHGTEENPVKTQLAIDPKNPLNLRGTITFAENEEFIVNLGMNGTKYYENYKHYLELANDKVIQGELADETHHNFKAIEAGEYEIIVGGREYEYLGQKFVNYDGVYITHGDQPVVHHGSGETWVDTRLEPDTENDDQLVCKGLHLEANEQFVLNLRHDTWKHFTDFVDDRKSNGTIVDAGGEDHNFKATEAGDYDIYVNGSGKVFVVHGEPSAVKYTFACGANWDITADNAVFYAALYEYQFENLEWVELELKGTAGAYYFEVDTTSVKFTAIICRMDPNYNDGLDFTDPDVPSWGAVWDQSNDLALSGETGTVNFNFL